MPLIRPSLSNPNGMMAPSPNSFSICCIVIFSCGLSSRNLLIGEGASAGFFFSTAGMAGLVLVVFLAMRLSEDVVLFVFDEVLAEVIMS